MFFLRLLFCCALLGLFAGSGRGAETLPPKPSRYFNDYARVVPTQQASALNQRLEQFERDTSNQLVVAVFPRMESASSIEDYTVRIAQSWGVGEKQRDNGVILFVFLADRKMYIQVGYGLEGALPDALGQTIIQNELKPRFRQGDYAGGLDAATRAIIAATQGEYRGTGRTRAGNGHGNNQAPVIFGGIILLIVMASAFSRRNSAHRNTVFGGSGHHYGNRGWGGSSWGGGGAGGGGFSGGGGSFGGGGSGGSW